MASKKVIVGKGKAISILILGDISAWWGANSKILYDTLRNKEVENINLYISSDGGSLNEALVMYDMLKGHKAKVTAYLTGIVASAATVVACACDEVKISKQSTYMIHRSMSYMYGNANAMKKTASILEMFDNKVIEIYSQFAGARKKDLRKKLLWELIDSEYFTDQAGVMALGLADQVIEHVEFDFDTEEMDWRFYSSGEHESDTATAPENLAKYGAYYGKVLQVKGYKFLSTNDIKNKLDMKGMKSVFASLVAFLGGQGFLKDGVMDDAKAAVENFNMGDDIENFIQTANAEALKQTTDIVNGIRDKFEGQLQELNTRIENVVNTNKELEAQNKELRTQLETDKNTVENFRKSVTDELAQVKNMKSVVNGNGEGIADPQQPIGDSMTDDERAFYASAVNRGNISKEQYKEITGAEFK